MNSSLRLHPCSSLCVLCASVVNAFFRKMRGATSTVPQVPGRTGESDLCAALNSRRAVHEIPARWRWPGGRRGPDQSRSADALHVCTGAVTAILGGMTCKRMDNVGVVVADL